MKSLLIATLAAIGLTTCACSSLVRQADGPQATATTPAAHTVAAPHRHHHHHPTPVNPGGSGSAQAAGSGSGTGSGSGSGGAPSGQGTQSGSAPCLSRYLGASVGIGQGTVGKSYVVLVFKNLNNTPCTLYGYPGVSFGGGTPVTQIGKAATENPATPRQLVTLAPGGYANALLQIVHAANYPAPVCGPVTAHWLQIFPPNQTVPIYLAFNYPACAKPVGLLTVNVVAPGSGG
jgi:hypothetical protein